MQLSGQKRIMKSINFPVKKSIALLLDPDKVKGESLDKILEVAEENRIDYILAGGSLTFNSIDSTYRLCKGTLLNSCDSFPGESSSAKP